jgi:hypothetical protein
MDSRHYIAADRLSFDSDQVNVWGWSKMQDLAKVQGVELVSIFLPPRQQYMAEMVHPKARLEFLEYMKGFDHRHVFFPQLPEDGYYDLIHPNKMGRKIQSQYLLDWLKHPVQGAMPELTWPLPDYYLDNN